MKLYPFSRVQSVHLKPLLYLARFIGAIACFFLTLIPIGFIGYLISKMFGFDIDYTNLAENYAHIESNTVIIDWSAVSSWLMLVGVYIGVTLLIISSVLAALVAIEHKITASQQSD